MTILYLLKEDNKPYIFKGSLKGWLQKLRNGLKVKTWRRVNL